MRQIKFRGKGLEMPVFYYGNLQNIRDFGNITSFIVDEYVPNQISNMVDSETVGQFIGLKDIKSDEIYEGDVLEVTKDSRGDFKVGDTFEVKYSDDCATFYITPFIENNTKKNEDILYFISKDMVEERGFTIIGNIHQTNIK